MKENKEIWNVNQLVNQLLEKGNLKMPNIDITTDDEKIKLNIINMMCKMKEEDDEIHFNVIKNLPRDCPLQSLIILFFINLAIYPVKELLLGDDAISSLYFTIKSEKEFIDFVKTKREKQKKIIPFFLMIEFIAYINIQKDTSKDVEKLMKNNFIKGYISQYIEKKRSLAWKIIFLYVYIILDGYDKDLDIEDESLIDISSDNLKAMYQQYMCFNYLYNEGEIASFMDCLFSALTEELNNIYLKEGPQIEYVNNLISFILKEISEQFTMKNYFHKKSMNELYESIAEIIREFNNIIVENNYVTFILEYSKYFKQGDKNIVLLFLSGLNPNNFQKIFNKLYFNNNDNNYYKNINLELNKIKTGIKKMKSKNKEIDNEKNKIDAKFENTNNNMINTSEEKEEKKENIKNSQFELAKQINIQNSNPKEEDNHIKKDNNIIELNQKDKDEPNNEKKDKNPNENEMIQHLIKQINELKLELQKNNEEIKDLKDKNVKMTNKIINSNFKTKMEVLNLKKEMRKINYRDISRNIINDYLNKYHAALNLTKLTNKKDKAIYIGKNLLKGSESTYYNQIVDKYYDSDYKSHISVIFNEYGKKCIVGSKFDKNDVIEKVYVDYCDNIFDDKVDVNNVENRFKIKTIIENLYIEIMINSRYS